MNLQGTIGGWRRSPAVMGLVLGLAMVMAVATSAALAAPAQDTALDTYLTREVWHDDAFGVSLRPPLGSQLRHESADDVLLVISGDPGYVIRVVIRKSKGTLETRVENTPKGAVTKGDWTVTQGDLTIPKVMELSRDQITLSRRISPRILEQTDKLTLAGHPAGRIYYSVPDAKLGTWCLGQTFILIDPRTVLMVTLQASTQHFPAARPIYQAVCDSLRLEDPRKLDEARKKLIESGQKWQRTVKFEAIAAVASREQWYRIIQNGLDVGYMRVKLSPDKELGMSGLQSVVQARLKLADGVYDTLAKSFLSQDMGQEIWSIQTTRRPAGSAPPTVRGPAAAGQGQPNTVTWVESGLRTGPLLRVTREGPAGMEQHKWPTPESGYIPQVELVVLGSLLPHDHAASYGFYAYYANSGKLTLRTERVVPGSDGGYAVYTRTSLEQPELKSRYDSSGQLLERDMGGGRRLVRSSQADIKAIWKSK